MFEVVGGEDEFIGASSRLQQPQDPPQIGSNIRDHQQLRLSQGDQTAPWSQQRFDFLSRAGRVQAMNRHPNGDQLMIANGLCLARLFEFLQCDFRHQTLIQLLVQVDHDEETVFVDQCEAFSNQVAVDDVQCLGRRVFAPIEVRQCAGGNPLHVQSQIIGVGEHLQDTFPGRVTKVEGKQSCLLIRSERAGSETGDGAVIVDGIG